MLIGPLAQAQYKVIGPDGKVSYTDRPPLEAGHQVKSMNLGNSVSGLDNTPLPTALREVANRYPVTLYTANGCTSCDTARNLLIQRGIPFTERRIESGADAEAYKKLTGGSRDLPMMTVGAQQVRPTTPADWHSYLDAAGYPKDSTLPGSYRRPNPTPLTTSATAAASRDGSEPPPATTTPADAGNEAAAAGKSPKIKF